MGAPPRTPRRQAGVDAVDGCEIHFAPRNETIGHHLSHNQRERWQPKRGFMSKEISRDTTTYPKLLAGDQNTESNQNQFHAVMGSLRLHLGEASPFFPHMDHYFRQTNKNPGETAIAFRKEPWLNRMGSHQPLFFFFVLPLSGKAL